MILSPLACAACGDARPTLVLPPAELATCADDPQAPDLSPRPALVTAADIPAYVAAQLDRDRATLEYILGLRSAGGDCRAKVQGLATWREAAQ